MKPEIAVLTPLRGHAMYIEEMLWSLVAQTFTAWECCIVLDGPDDAALAAIARVSDPRITCVHLNKPQGAAAARNIAARNTSARWLMPFDADDIMTPQYLHTLHDAVSARMSLSPARFTGMWPIAYAAARCLYPDRSVSVFQYPSFDAEHFTRQFQIPNATLHPRALWDVLRGWDEAWTQGAEDWHYWTRAVALRLIDPVNIARDLWVYREHDGARHSRVGKTHFAEHKKIMDQILKDGVNHRRDVPLTTRKAPPTVLDAPPPSERAPWPQDMPTGRSG